jgi:basic membrane lipoprotein Med (substrate-binding protein (PBP1-ABC) superfamily)
MNGSRWIAVVVLAVLVVCCAGCGGTSGAKVEKIALVSPGRYNDVDWWRQGLEAFEDTVQRLRVRGEIADDVRGADAPAAVEQVSRDAQLVIANDGRYAAAAAAAAERTKVPELVWGHPGLLKPGRVGDVEVQAAEGAYAAGPIVMHAVNARRLGIVVADDGGSWEAKLWNEMAGGFVAGVRSVDPHVAFDLVRVGHDGQATAADAAQAAARLIARKTVVIFALGGRSAIGVLRAAERHGGFYVGTIGPKEAERTNESSVLTAVLWNVGPTFRRAVADLRHGTFGRRPYALTLANGGITLLATGVIGGAFDFGARAADAISHGRITVPSTPTDADVQTLLAGGTQG